MTEQWEIGTMQGTGSEDNHTGETVEVLKRAIMDNLYYREARIPAVATRNDWYLAVAYTVRDRIMNRWVKTLDVIMKKARAMDLVVGTFGLVTPEKRLATVARAVAEGRLQVPDDGAVDQREEQVPAEQVGPPVGLGVRGEDERPAVGEPGRAALVLLGQPGERRRGEGEGLVVGEVELEVADLVEAAQRDAPLEGLDGVMPAGDVDHEAAVGVAGGIVDGDAVLLRGQDVLAIDKNGRLVEEVKDHVARRAFVHPSTIDVAASCRLAISLL